MEFGYSRKVDETTRRVVEMYAAFPYPSPKIGSRNLKELRNLLTIFAAENGYDFKGKRVLDAGTGTGHRLIEAARAFPETQFVAVDIGEYSLEIARRTAAEEKVHNIQFLRANLMEEPGPRGAFDVILCMGVLHILSDPRTGLRNLTRLLATDGLLFLYIYGAHGGRERMRRKKIVSLLQGSGLQGSGASFEQGIRFVQDLGFDSFEYGWNLNFDDQASRRSLIVDAYLHVHEQLFDADSIFALMRGSGLYGFLTYGLTLAQRGCLFDARCAPATRAMIESTAVDKYLKTQDLRDAYEKLSLPDRYRLIDLLFEPNGYTLLAFPEGAKKRFAPEGRVASNTLRLADL